MQEAVDIAYYDPQKTPQENARLLGREDIEEEEAVHNLYYERLIEHVQWRATRMLQETGRISNEMRALLSRLEDAQGRYRFEEGIEMIRNYQRNTATPLRSREAGCRRHRVYRK